MSEAIEHYAGVLAALPDPTLAARAADVRSVGRRLLAAWPGGPPAPEGPLVLVATEITADDLLSAADVVVGAASVVGGATSHAAIVARSLGVPLGFGADPALLAGPTARRSLLDLRRRRGRRGAGRRAAGGGRGGHRGRPPPAGATGGRAGPPGGAPGTGGRSRCWPTWPARPMPTSPVRMAVPGVGLLRTEMPFLDGRSGGRRSPSTGRRSNPCWPGWPAGR